MNHQILLKRLECDCGIPLRWIESYLSDRWFFVRVGSSSSFSCRCSVWSLNTTVLGPLLFTSYVAPIRRLTESYGVHYHKYTDDTQLHTALTVQLSGYLNHLQDYLFTQWLSQPSSRMHVRPSTVILAQRLASKSRQVCFFRTRQRLQRLNLPSSVAVASCCIGVCEKRKTLAITLDNTLSFDDHVNGNVRSCHFYIRADRNIRRSLTGDVTNTIACSIVHSRLDYCNSLLYGASKKSPDRLQRVQNKLARVVHNIDPRQHHSIDLLRE